MSTRTLAKFEDVLIVVLPREGSTEPRGHVLPANAELDDYLNTIGNSFADTGLEEDEQIEKLAPGTYAVNLLLIEDKTPGYWEYEPEYNVYLACENV